MRADAPGWRPGPWLPVACYLGVTVLAPALHGAAARPGFAVHAATVLALALAAGLGLALAARGLRRVRRRGPPPARRA